MKMEQQFEFEGFEEDNTRSNFSIHLRNLNKDDLKLLSDVLEATGQKTHSKALLDAYSGFLLYKRKYSNLERRYLELVKKYT